MSLAFPAHARSENLRGILAMLASTAVFVLNDTLLKVATEALPTGEAIFLRGLFTTLFCAVLFARHGTLGAVAHVVSPRNVGGAIAEVGSTLFFLSALVRMPIGDAIAILQFTPLAITAGAAVFLGERVGWRRWLATGVGLVGVLIIVRPGGAAFNPFSVLALVSILFGVARDLLTRGMDQSVPSLLIAGTSSAAVTLASLGFIAFEDLDAGRRPRRCCSSVGSSTALVAGQYWLITAMRTGEIAVVAPFRYSVILWAVLAGYLVWDESPDAASWLGIAIVTAAGIYTFLREQRLARPSDHDRQRARHPGDADRLHGLRHERRDGEARDGRAARRRDHRHPRRAVDRAAGDRRHRHARDAPDRRAADADDAGAPAAAAGATIFVVSPCATYRWRRSTASCSSRRWRSRLAPRWSTASGSAGSAGRRRWPAFSAWC